jgi:polyhydroxybutyrate depolymerase
VTDPTAGSSDNAPPPSTKDPARRRARIIKSLIALGVVVLIVLGLISAVIEYSRTHQNLVLPPAGHTITTTPPHLSQAKRTDVSSLAVQQGSNTRRAEFYLPIDRDPAERLPVVILLHGHSGNGGLIVREGNWEAAVAADHFIVVTPEGVQASWNAGKCCRLASTLGIHDEQFLDALVNDLRLRPEVDSKRIYMVGESNGGMMTYRYACDHGAKLAGVASVVGTNVAGCAPNGPVPILHIAGTADQVVPYNGGRSVVSVALADGPFPGVAPSLRRLARGEGCDSTPTETAVGPKVTATEWSGCRGGVEVRLMTVTGMKHLWPKAPQLDATGEILSFFGLTS